MPNVQIKVVTIPPASSGFIPFARVIHSKLMTIDDEIAWVGTSNWTGGYLDNSRNLELVMHSAAMSGRLDQLYQQLWNSVYAEPLRLDYDYPTPAGRRILISRARLIPAPCVLPTPAGLLQRRHQLLGVQPFRPVAVAAHAIGRQQRIHDRFLHRFRCCGEQRRNVVVVHHVQRRGESAFIGVVGGRQAVVAGSEGDENVAARILGAAAGAGDADAGALRQPRTLVRQQRRVGRQRHHDGAHAGMR